jgi:hypothetical protein
LEHDHDLERGIKHVKPPPNSNRTFATPCIKPVRSTTLGHSYVKPDGSGELIPLLCGMLLFKMPLEDLMKAIKLYTEFKAIACKITKEQPRIDC